MSSNDQHTDYQEYLASMHAKLTTPEEAIKEVTKEGTGQEVKDRRRIVAGEVNEVYDLTLNNGQHTILRISRNFPDFLQILCFNCNCGRNRNGGICPHMEAAKIPASPS